MIKHEMKIEILKVDGFTKKEAENALKRGTSIVEAEDMEDVLKQFNEVHEEPITIENIKKGIVEDFRIVTYAGNDYLIIDVR